MSMACKEYVEPDDEVARQAISQQNQIQAFLITNGPLIATVPRKRPVATQSNCITNKEQHVAVVHFFGPQTKCARVTTSVTTTDNLVQQHLLTD